MSHSTAALEATHTAAIAAAAPRDTGRFVQAAAVDRNSHSRRPRILLQAVIKHKWTVQATVPAAAGMWIAYWSGNILYGLAAVVLLTGLLVLLYRKIFLRGIRLLINYKSTIVPQ